MKLFVAYMHLLIFLSLTTTLPAVAKYAKTGCNDTCGNNVMIPFPFGIGADCAINQWYIVKCNNVMPHLPAFNHMEVLGVNLENQIVTVSTPRITAGCQNPVGNISQNMSMNLGGSPFFFSKSHNNFVFEGCGTAAIMMDDESVVTGCSTTCVNGRTVLTSPAWERHVGLPSWWIKLIHMTKETGFLTHLFTGMHLLYPYHFYGL
ncbi:hypothetical protein R6Q59_007774 [Mikania micrantha]